jgi:hypothetical protein
MTYFEIRKYKKVLTEAGYSFLEEHLKEGWSYYAFGPRIKIGGNTMVRWNAKDPRVRELREKFGMKFVNKGIAYVRK